MKYLFFFTAIISLLFCDDNSNIISESYKFSNNDMIIDSSDYNLNKEIGAPLVNEKTYYLSFNYGKIISLDKDDFKQGNSIGLSLFLPHDFYFGNKNLNGLIELNFSNLSSSLSGKYWYYGDVDLNSINFVLNKKILNIDNKKNSLISIGLGGGVLNHSSWGIMSSILVDLNYRIPNDKFIMLLNFRLHKVINLTKEYELDFNNYSHNLYSISLNFGQKLQLRK